ncbi:MAG: hypothetical protein ACRDBY_00730 [Cetobacterium sp.]
MLNVPPFYVGDITKRLKDVKIEISNPIRVNSELLDYVKFDLTMSRGERQSKTLMILDYDSFISNTKEGIVRRLQGLIDMDIVFIDKDVKWTQDSLAKHIVKELGYEPNTEDYDFVINKSSKRDFRDYRFFTDVLDVEEILYLKEWEIYDGLKKYWYQ